MPNRWWIYQRERFPILAHGPLIAAFSFSAVCFSRLLRVPDGSELEFPGALTVTVAFFTCFFFFLQLRIADEFKDFQEDSQYRPYRPVPRGLVTLRELGILWAITGLLQLVLALWLEPTLAILLLIVWIYLALMSKEFFFAEWLKGRPLLYMFSHMIIVPLVDFYATACDWWPAGDKPVGGLLCFVIVSYFNGIVIEVGRKIRAPEGEEEGVNTYTAIWGMRNAALFWLGFLFLTAIAASIAAYQIDFLMPVVILLLLLLFVAGFAAWRFLQKPNMARAKTIEAISALWTLLMYLSLGTIPLLWRLWT